MSRLAADLATCCLAATGCRTPLWPPRGAGCALARACPFTANYVATLDARAPDTAFDRVGVLWIRPLAGRWEWLQPLAVGRIRRSWHIDSPAAGAGSVRRQYCRHSRAALAVQPPSHSSKRAALPVLAAALCATSFRWPHGRYAQLAHFPFTSSHWRRASPTILANCRRPALPAGTAPGPLNSPPPKRPHWNLNGARIELGYLPRAHSALAHHPHRRSCAIRPSCCSRTTTSPPS